MNANSRLYVWLQPPGTETLADASASNSLALGLKSGTLRPANANASDSSPVDQARSGILILVHVDAFKKPVTRSKNGTLRPATVIVWQCLCVWVTTNSMLQLADVVA